MSSPGNMENKIDDLIAKAEIHDLLLRYSRGCDRADEEELRSVFHPDAEVDYGQFKGLAGEFAAWGTKIHLEQFVSTSHFILNSLIVVDGDCAHGETYVMAWLRSSKDGCLDDMTAACRYIDRFEKRSGTWKIAHRVVVVDRDLVETDVVTSAETLTGSLVKGLRTRDDLSYRAVGRPDTCDSTGNAPKH